MKSLISFFTERHLLTNVLFFGLMILSVFVWQNIGKEEMPEFSFDWIRINAVYPGASAEDIELLVIKPIEDELKTVVGIEELKSTASQGVASLMVYIDPALPDLKEVIQEIKDATLRADLPAEVRDLPSFRQFKSSEKAIMDIGFILKDKEFLDTESRKLLQKFALSFENQITALKEISSISRSDYLKPEIQIYVSPKKMLSEEISLTKIKGQIQENHIRTPVGALTDKSESKITALKELETADELKALVLRGNYQGQSIKLGDIADIRDGFDKSTTITKINGKQGVFFNVKKSISTDILTAQEKTLEFIEKFKLNNKDAPFEIVVLDDESFDVTNRLKIITSNGIIGFFLLLITLFIFLNFRTGFWVAMGIPFSISFTLLLAYFAGYTVNNMTLAGIIIVLGVVVDDAIIIAENIMRKVEEGLTHAQAAVQGPIEVFAPIIASIATTIVAFVPLMFFEGHFGKFIAYIPLMITLMLLGSLVESLFILPSHLSSESKFFKKFPSLTKQRTWFNKYEVHYKDFLIYILNKRIYVIGLFLCLLATGGYIYKTKMKFVMFPREESKEVVIKVIAPKDTPRETTARMIGKIEQIFLADKENVVGLRAHIAKSRRGGEVKENEATILVELYPADERKTPLNKLMKKWKKQTDAFTEFEKIKFLRGRWGNDSGSAVSLRIQENDDKKRSYIAKEIKAELEKYASLEEVEIEAPLIKTEFLFYLIQDNLVRFNVSPASITTALRTFAEGSILYSVNKGEEEVDVRLTVSDEKKTNIQALLALRIENRTGNLVPISKMVRVEEVKRPLNISRVDYKRTTMLYADLKAKAKDTPLEIAERMEKEVLPRLNKESPTTIFKFTGEIENSRESEGDFKNSILIASLLIYLILVIIFNSLVTPVMVLAIIPFGFAGVVYVLMIHGMSVYGFFAVIGTLGMMGVVINDAIVMVSKIETTIHNCKENITQHIAEISATRLRPVILTTITTVIGIVPTAYGWSGYDSMLAEMMITLGWGLAFGTIITLFLIPTFYSLLYQLKGKFKI